jgi:predicted chitinase
MILTSPKKLSELSNDELKEVQSALNKLGFDCGIVDGLFGPRTLDAWSDFKESINQHDPAFLDQIGPASYKQLIDAVDKNKSVPHDFSTKEGTVKAIRFECDRQGLTLTTQKAYVLATVQHETANTFKPIAEYGRGVGRTYGKPDPITGKTYFGRGYVQLTWRSNYQKYSQLLGIDLVNSPDLAMGPNVALFILVHGFKTGAFTGKKLTDYVNINNRDFVNARRCINGLDKAQHIANLANKFLNGKNY